MLRRAKWNRSPRLRRKYRKFNWGYVVAFSCCAVDGQINYFEIMRDFMYDVRVRRGLLQRTRQRERIETIIVDEPRNSAASGGNQPHCLGRK